MTRCTAVERVVVVAPAARVGGALRPRGRDRAPGASPAGTSASRRSCVGDTVVATLPASWRAAARRARVRRQRGGARNPVRIRDGCATVTGDAAPRSQELDRRGTFHEGRTIPRRTQSCDQQPTVQPLPLRELLPALLLGVLFLLDDLPRAVRPGRPLADRLVPPRAHARRAPPARRALPLALAAPGHHGLDPVRRGLVVGAIAGLLAGAFAFVFGEPRVQDAIDIEDAAAR